MSALANLRYISEELQRRGRWLAFLSVLGATHAAALLATEGSLLAWGSWLFWWMVAANWIARWWSERHLIDRLNEVTGGKP